MYLKEEMERMNVSKLTLTAWPPSQSLHLRRHTTPGSHAPSLSLSLSYCWAEAQQHQVTAGPVVQTTGGTPAACQYLSRGTQLALRDALDLILTRYLASYAAGPSPADHYYRCCRRRRRRRRRRRAHSPIYLCACMHACMHTR